MKTDDLAFFGMALIVLCLFLAALVAIASSERLQLLTQLQQCEARNE